MTAGGGNGRPGFRSPLVPSCLWEFGPLFHGDRVSLTGYPPKQGSAAKAHTGVCNRDGPGHGCALVLTCGPGQLERQDTQDPGSPNVCSLEFADLCSGASRRYLAQGMDLAGHVLRECLKNALSICRGSVRSWGRHRRRGWGWAQRRHYLFSSDSSHGMGTTKVGLAGCDGTSRSTAARGGGWCPFI